jgi:hypothetical protein
MSTARQWLGKHAPMAADAHTTIELLEAVFSMWSVLRLYDKEQRGVSSQS